MKFREFVQEVKKLKLSTEEYSVVNTITNAYIEKYQKLSDKELYKITTKLPKSLFSRVLLDSKDKTLTPRYTHLGGFAVSERKTNTEKKVDVFLITHAESSANDGVYYDSTEEIFLFHDKLKNYFKTDIFTVVSHEIIHAVQHYKKTSDAYNLEVVKDEPSDSYHLETVEVEATVSSVINSLYLISDEFISLVKKYIERGDLSVVKLYAKKHNKFLNSILNFIKTPLTELDNLTLSDVPKVIYDKLNFFKSLNTDPTKAKKYKILLYKAVETMEKEFTLVLKKTA